MATAGNLKVNSLLLHNWLCTRLPESVYNQIVSATVETSPYMKETRARIALRNGISVVFRWSGHIEFFPEVKLVKLALLADAENTSQQTIDL